MLLFGTRRSLIGAANAVLTGAYYLKSNLSAITVSAIISGNAALNKFDSAIVTLTGSNTFTGGLNINQGGIVMGAAGSIPSSSAISLANIPNTYLDLNGNTITIGALSGGGSNGGNIINSGATATLSIAGASFAGSIQGPINVTGTGVSKTFDFSSSQNTYTGVSTFNTNGTIVIVTSWNSYNGGVPPLAFSSLGVPSLSSASQKILARGTINYNGPGESTDRILSPATALNVVNNGSGTLTFTTLHTVTSVGLTFSGSSPIVLAGQTGTTGIFSYTGTSTCTLTGTSTTTGATTLNGTGSILYVNGATSASSAVAVTLGTLAGTGNCNGSVTVANTSGAVIAPGSGTGTSGTLNTGALTFSGSNSAITIFSNGTTASKANVTGACALGGCVVNLANAMAAGTYNLIVASGTMSGTLPVIGTNSSGRTPTLSQVGNTLTLTLV